MSEVAVRPAEGTPAARGGLELSRAQMNVVFVTILLGLLLSALDQTIVGDLGGAGHVSWVVTGLTRATSWGGTTDAWGERSG